MKTKNKLILGLAASNIAGRVLENLNKQDNVTQNTQTTFNGEIDTPLVDQTAYIHHFASVLGSVTIKKQVFVGPFASIRGDEGLQIHIGEYTNIQDGVVIHGWKNFEYGNNITKNSVYKDNAPYSVNIGDRCSLSPQSQVHGPSRIDSDVYVGMQCLVFDSHIQKNVIMEPGAKAIGVTIPENRYIRAGNVITSQEAAEQLPTITEEYHYYRINEKLVHTYMELVPGYKGDGMQ